MRFFRYTIGAGLLVLLVLATPTNAQRKKRGGSERVISVQEAQAAKRKRNQLGSELSGLRNKMHNVRERIHTAEVKENRLTDTIETVTARIGQTEGRLTQAQRRLRRLENEHDSTVQRLHDTEERLNGRRDLLAQRMRENYRRGNTSYLQVLLQSRTLQEMISRNYYVRRIVDSDATLIAGIRDDIRQIEKDKKRLEAQAQEQQELASEFESQKEQLASDRVAQRELLKGVQQVKAQAENQLDDLEEEANNMVSRIRQLSEMLRRRQEAERRRVEAERRRLLAQARRAAAKGGGKGATAKIRLPQEAPSLPQTVWRGGFMRPVNGPITSGFGYRYHPILHRRKLHTGTDFGVPYGTTIRAAGGGTVILATYSGGYGNCIIIDHGNGVTTLYGHCSALLVSEGQTVTQGQPIGRVGSTGLSTGPHLHWEVRRNGTPVSPP